MGMPAIPTQEQRDTIHKLADDIISRVTNDEGEPTDELLEVSANSRDWTPNGLILVMAQEIARLRSTTKWLETDREQRIRDTDEDD